MPLQPGSRIGNFVIIGQIDKGAFGIVYKARDIDLDRLVAIKELIAHAPGVDTAGYQSQRKKFEHEVKTLSSFSHPNVVAAYQVVHQPNADYLVMEYVGGDSLKKKIGAGRPLAIEQAVAIAIDICHALDELSKYNIVHRDIKPANILMTLNGQAKLTDFGVAQVGKDSRRSDAKPRTHPGTPRYMSPEQESSTAYLDQRSDLYSLGLVLYEMLTGQNYKVTRTPARKLNPAVPHTLETVLERTLQKEPDQRYQTAATFEQALTRSLSQVQRPHISIPRGMWIGVGTVIALALIGVVLTLRPTINDPSQAVPLPRSATSVKSRTTASATAPQPTTTVSVSVARQYNSLEIVSSSDARYQANEDVVLQWEPPQDATSLGPNQEYRVWLTYLDADGRAQEIVLATTNPQITLPREQFFNNYQPVAQDGRYQWAVSVVQVLADQSIEEISPRTAPLYTFYWKPQPPTPVPAPATQAATPVGSPASTPTVTCPSGQFWNAVMNRCQNTPGPEPKSTPARGGE
jgi:serine/threonine protein kinase